MAAKKMMAREKRREQYVARDAERRAALKKTARSLVAEPAEVMEANRKLKEMRRNGSAVRLRNRCQQCGRPKGVYQYFGLCRLCLRKAAALGYVPGLKKASW